MIETSTEAETIIRTLTEHLRGVRDIVGITGAYVVAIGNTGAVRVWEEETYYWATRSSYFPFQNRYATIDHVGRITRH